jgi:hypothetical protein
MMDAFIASREHALTMCSRPHAPQLGNLLRDVRFTGAPRRPSCADERGARHDIRGPGH